MEEKLQQLTEAIEAYCAEDVCLAFSGGVDSSLLLKIISDQVKKHGTQVYAVTFHTKLHPACDLEIAKAVVNELGGIHVILEVDELEQEEILYNPVNRCYLCKRYLFRTLRDFAESKGITCIMDGTNEDDMHVYRPGIQALRELDIYSPLANLHVTKEEVKRFAAWHGISVASRPSTPCMATRLPYGAELDYELLHRIELGETWLRENIGGNVRLRVHGDVVRLEVDKTAFQGMLERGDEIAEYLKGLGFLYITMDLEGFRSGSMDVNVAVNGYPEI